MHSWRNRLGQSEDRGRIYDTIARSMASEWIKMAADGDHYRLAFDQPGTWSQKYNLVWDRLLGLNLFPPDVRPEESPTTSRSRIVTACRWTIARTTPSSIGLSGPQPWPRPCRLRAFVVPVFAFVNESPSRVPVTDWYDTVDGKQRGFQARSVVGGIYIKMLADAWAH